MKKDIYTIENDFTADIELLDKALHQQVLYTDNRLYQKFLLEWDNYRLLDVRDFVKEIEKNKGIMDMLSTVQPFSIYGFASDKLSITFKKDLIFSKKRALSTMRYIVGIGSKKIYLENN